MTNAVASPPANPPGSPAPGRALNGWVAGLDREAVDLMATQRYPVTPRTTFGWMTDRVAEQVMGGIGE